MPTLQTFITYLTSPARLRERLIEKRMYARSKTVYANETPDIVQKARLALLGEQAAPFVEEARALPLYQHIADARQDTLVRSQTTGTEDCLTMYALVRLYQPRVMVETGVFFGAMSAMILAAMQANGGGRLYSIDLPTESDGLTPEQRGSFVPAELRPMWTLILGDAREKLPPLLADLGTIDAFNHDSLHTTQHMLWEYKMAWPHLRAGGMLSSHDVMYTPAWERFTGEKGAQLHTVGRIYGLGVALKRS